MRFADGMSIRMRITLGTLLLAAAVFTCAAVVVHALVKNLLIDSTASLLDADMISFETSLVLEPYDDVDIPPEGQLILVVDPSGTEHASTIPAALRTELGDAQKLPVGSRGISVGDSRYLVGVEQVRNAVGTWTVVGARDQSSDDLVLSCLTSGMVAGAVALVGAFALLSWSLTGAALRPVERLRRSAEQIVDSGSDSLLPETPARDEIQQLASTLNRLIEDLHASVARERQMVSDASHELRTPLAILRGRLELLRTGDRSRLDEDIAEAERAAQRLSRTATDLLELSRLEASGSRAAAALAELIDETGRAVDRARFVCADRGIRIELSVSGAVRQTRAVAIRPSTFGRIADNLLENAAAAVEPGGSIEVRLGVASDEVTLSVADSGGGVPEAFLPHAFDRFSRADDARSGRPGAGLGLAIVAAATHAAGGRVALENRPSGGAVATVRLPLGESLRRARAIAQNAED
ncbi:MAG: sensor histidine kinase [Leucobacter sp.]